MRKGKKIFFKLPFSDWNTLTVHFTILEPQYQEIGDFLFRIVGQQSCEWGGRDVWIRKEKYLPGKVDWLRASEEMKVRKGSTYVAEESCKLVPRQNLFPCQTFDTPWAWAKKTHNPLLFLSYPRDDFSSLFFIDQPFVSIIGKKSEGTQGYRKSKGTRIFLRVFGWVKAKAKVGCLLLVDLV